MPTNEKEYNGYLFDQLSILERIEAVTDDEKALKQIAMERRSPLNGGRLKENYISSHCLKVSRKSAREEAGGPPL